MRLGIWTSVVSLTVVNVFAGYFSQFLTVFTAIAEALLLWALLRYRDRSGRAADEPHDAVVIPDTAPVPESAVG